MSVVKDCIHAMPTRSMRCLVGRKICAGEQCSEFIRHRLEREPTGHEWILLTNKYFKLNEAGHYAKGIITYGVEYIFYVKEDVSQKLWILSVYKEGFMICLNAEFLNIRYAIQAGSDIIKHLIADDINRKPKQGKF